MGKEIEKFLETFTAKATKYSYRSALNKYFECIGVKDEEYFKKERDYEADVRKFFATYKESPPKTIRLLLTVVRTFLIENDIELSQRFWRRLRGRIKGNRALTMDKVPSNAELRKILTHMDAKGKALYLTLSSSGMRIGESLKLKFEDVDLNVDPPRINIQGEYTKSGNPRIAFISEEAKETVDEWLKIRSKYLKTAVLKSTRYDKNPVDERIFPFEPVTARRIWNNAIGKSGFGKMDNNTNRHIVHPHVLRKFFRTKMGGAIPLDVTEALMGHEGYLTEVYRRYPPEKLAEFYKQGEPNLSVFTEVGKVTELKKKVEQSNEQLQSLVNGLTNENMGLRAKVNILNDRMQKFDDFMNKSKGFAEQVEEWTKIRDDIKEYDKHAMGIFEEIKKAKKEGGGK